MEAKVSDLELEAEGRTKLIRSSRFEEAGGRRPTELGETSSLLDTCGSFKERRGEGNEKVSSNRKEEVDESEEGKWEGYEPESTSIESAIFWRVGRGDGKEWKERRGRGSEKGLVEGLEGRNVVGREEERRRELHGSFVSTNRRD